jgi:hypothetical protein
MSILGGVYTFFGPIVGAFMLQLMDADITKDYPQIWQLFLGSMLVLILYGLPGGIMGFIQARDTAGTDDAATRVRKAMGEFSRKFWYFFAATLFFTGFFRILQAPDTWKTTVLLTAAQAIMGVVLCPWMLRQLNTFSQKWRVVFLLFPIVPLALHTVGFVALPRVLRTLHIAVPPIEVTPLSGLMIVVLWAVFIYSYLWQAEIREAFGQPYRAALETAPGAR